MIELNSMLKKQSDLVISFLYRILWIAVINTSNRNVKPPKNSLTNH